MNKTTQHRQVAPIPGRTKVLRHQFSAEKAVNIHDELTDRTINAAFPKGSAHALPVQDAIDSLKDGHFLSVAHAVESLGRLAAFIDLTHVAHYDVDPLQYTRPQRNQLAGPALRMSVALRGVSEYRTGGIAVFGRHYMGETTTVIPGDVMLVNDMSVAQLERSLVSVESARGINGDPHVARWTLDFLPGPTTIAV